MTDKIGMTHHSIYLGQELCLLSHRWLDASVTGTAAKVVSGDVYFFVRRWTVHVVEKVDFLTNLS